MPDLAKQAEVQTTSASRTKILDAAEAEFITGGYAGAGMKAIAVRAGVAQGLLHYHFGAKDKLYEAVVARRAETISAAREAMLEKVDLSDSHALERIFEALYTPNFEEEGGGRAYAVIFNARYVSDSDAADLVNKYYDPTAQRFIDAILTAVPTLSRDAASWGYIFAIGALLTALIRDDRQERLAGLPQRDAAATKRLTVQALVLNATGGIRLLGERLTDSS